MLTINNLKAGYEGRAVVDIAALTIETGEHCLILGNSGSGKSTLLYALGGVLKPLSGSIRLGQVDIAGLSGAKLDAFRGRNIGIVFQALYMSPALSVTENILVAQYSAGLPQDINKAQALLARLGLAEYHAKKPDELSIGQQQRVAIARAAINSPKLILADEPTSALDDGSCAIVMELLLDTAKDSGASLLIATHDARIKKYFTKTINLGGL